MGTSDVAEVTACAKHPHCSKRVRHFVLPPYSARLEHPLRHLAPAVFERLLALVEWADSFFWHCLPTAAFPEAEYIVYEAPPDAAIGPHKDDDSAVTAVVMLSSSSAYVGGLNCFASTPAQVRLELGDVVFFRGECL